MSRKYGLWRVLSRLRAVLVSRFESRTWRGKGWCPGKPAAGPIPVQYTRVDRRGQARNKMADFARLLGPLWNAGGRLWTRMSPSHGENRGSSPLGSANKINGFCGDGQAATTLKTTLPSGSPNGRVSSRDHRE